MVTVRDWQFTGFVLEGIDLCQKIVFNLGFIGRLSNDRKDSGHLVVT